MDDRQLLAIMAAMLMGSSWCGKADMYSVKAKSAVESAEEILREIAHKRDIRRNFRNGMRQTQTHEEKT